ncbi:hypothetical protein NPIL_516771 [Nephila pilipes]|uniref:Uncharacterized protein n=1 Tax=Nephila pilipes TaxID=299642 RepID=A0A8X6TQC2_NEPPI|nr:hypothetical protein NPIL_516771 [Nephila pilipes]
MLQLTIDNWYASYLSAKSFLDITLLRTLRSNKKEIHREFLTMKSRVIALILLSAMYDDDSIESDTSKLSVILDYNKTNGGVDVVDKFGGSYTVARRS